MNKLISILLILMVTPLLIAAQSDDYEKRMHVTEHGILKYRILMPLEFSKDKKYPVLLFLHGSGERGNDNEKQLIHGSRFFFNNRNKYPAILLFPQCSENDYWASLIDDPDNPSVFKFDYGRKPTKSLQLVISLLDSIEQLQYVDNKRIYVGGLSMGGMGTLEILYRKPKTFAAAFSICGAGNTDSVTKYAKNTKLWLFHGAQDQVVLPEYSQKMVDALKNAGAKPKYTLYPKAHHNSWDDAFKEPKFLSWLFSQKSKKRR